MTSQPTVFVIDDDASVRDALEELIAAAGLRVETFASAGEFLAACDAKRPGCLLLDVRLPDIDGLSLQHRLRQAGIALPVILMTGYGDVPTAVHAFRNGAADFFQKPIDGDELLAALRAVIQRDGWRRRHAIAARETARRVGQLTEAERHVMDGLLAGRPQKAIAATLGVTLRTVQFHRTNIMRKMGADSLVGLAQMLHRPGMVLGS